MDMNNKIVNELTDRQKKFLQRMLNTGNILIFCDVSNNKNPYSKNDAFGHFHYFFHNLPYYLVIKTREEVNIYNYNTPYTPSASFNIDVYNYLEEHFKNLPNMINYNHKYLYKYPRYECLNDIDIDSIIYINKNKYDIDFKQCRTDLEFWISVIPFNKSIKENKFVNAYNINSVLESINGMCSDKEKYYLKLVKAMCEKNNFKKYYGEIADFEDKMIICNLYKEHYENI